MNRPDEKTLRRLEKAPTTRKIRIAGLTPIRYRARHATPAGKIYEQDQHGFIIEERDDRTLVFLVGLGRRWIKSDDRKHITELTQDRAKQIAKERAEREALLASRQPGGIDPATYGR